MDLLAPIFVFIVGLAVGSFFNVLIYRIPRGESIVAPSSHCPNCGHTLRFFDNVPLISYFVLRGRCRHCRQRISPQYPLVEALTALLFLAIFAKYSLSIKGFSALLFVSVIFLTAAIDVHHKIIPNKIIFPAFAAGFAFFFLKVFTGADLLPLVGVSGSAIYPLIGLVVGGGALLVPALIKEEWMGAGDVKLTALMGLFLGGYVVLALFIGSLIGSVVGGTLIFLKKLQKRETIPFGPFLAAGALATLFFGPQLFYFYLSLWG